MFSSVVTEIRFAFSFFKFITQHIKPLKNVGFFKAFFGFIVQFASLHGVKFLEYLLFRFHLYNIEKCAKLSQKSRRCYRYALILSLMSRFIYTLNNSQKKSVSFYFSLRNSYLLNCIAFAVLPTDRDMTKYFQSMKFSKNYQSSNDLSERISFFTNIFGSFKNEPTHCDKNVVFFVTELLRHFFVIVEEIDINMIGSENRFVPLLVNVMAKQLSTIVFTFIGYSVICFIVYFALLIFN